MNYYTLFYFFTVSDKLRNFFDVFSNIFTAGMVISGVIFLLLSLYVRLNQDDDDTTNQFWILAIRKVFIWASVLTFLSWLGYVAVPTKKEMVLIVAGGAVGNFLSQDTTARQLPHDVMVFLQTEIKSATKEAKLELFSDPKMDSLKQLPKEDLIKMLLEKEN